MENLKHTKEYAVKLSAEQYNEIPVNTVHALALTGKRTSYEKGYMKAIEETASPELLEALIAAYKCSGEKGFLTKPVLDLMLNAIKKSTE